MGASADGLLCNSEEACGKRLDGDMKIYKKYGVIFLDMIKPSNFHVHWRQFNQLMFTVPWTAKQFKYALGMLNLKNPLTQPLDANNYGGLATIEGRKINSSFIPYVALYLTDSTTPGDIDIAVSLDHILAAKLYPFGATTNSDSGVTNLKKMWPVFARMEEKGLPLCLHGEVTDPRIALWNRERVFVDTVLEEIHRAFPKLRIVLEHVSTREGVQFVQSTPSNIAGTVAPQYMLYNCNDVYLCPTRNCFPMINSPRDQRAVIDFATSGSGDCFLGTDSAPHPDKNKFCDGGSGGCITEPDAMSLYAEAFECVGKIGKLNGFASVFGPQFYGLEVPTERLLLVRKPKKVAKSVQIGPGIGGTPFMAGETLQWTVAWEEV